MSSITLAYIEDRKYSFVIRFHEPDLEARLALLAILNNYVEYSASSDGYLDVSFLVGVEPRDILLLLDIEYNKLFASGQVICYIVNHCCPSSNLAEIKFSEDRIVIKQGE